jgi:anti-anti-sigma factor
VRVHKRATVVAVTGELDLASSQLFEHAVSEALGAGTELVVIDLGELEFIDMSGLRVMLDGHDQIEREGKRLMLVNVGDAMMRLLRITGLTHLFELADNSNMPAELDEPSAEIWHRNA